MRARKKSWAEREISINETLVNDPQNYKNRWREYFDNDRPLYVELGCGKGRFITESAMSDPEINFIGVEREKQVLISGMRRARELGVKNIGFVLADACDLPSFFGENEIKRLYLNFCDPWPNRKKWAKRRLTHVNFLKLYWPLLDGRIFFKTDNLELFEFTLEQFAANNWVAENIERDLHGGGRPSPGLMTEYEEKFFNAGVPVMYCEAYKNTAL